MGLLSFLLHMVCGEEPTPTRGPASFLAFKKSCKKSKKRTKKRGQKVKETETKSPKDSEKNCFSDFQHDELRMKPSKSGVIIVTFFASLGVIAASCYAFCVLLGPLSWYFLYQAKYGKAHETGKVKRSFVGLPIWNRFQEFFQFECLRVSYLNPTEDSNFIIAYHGDSRLSPGVLGVLNWMKHIDVRILFPERCFQIPIFRAFLLRMGFVSGANLTATKNILNKRGKTSALLVMMPRGNLGKESFNLESKTLLDLLKISIATGSPVVPMVSHGDSAFNAQSVFKKGSILRALQDRLYRCFQLPVPGFVGSSFAGTGAGWIPKRTAVKTCYGLPVYPLPFKGKLQNMSFERKSRFLETTRSGKAMVHEMHKRYVLAFDQTQRSFFSQLIRRRNPNYEEEYFESYSLTTPQRVELDAAFNELHKQKQTELMLKCHDQLEPELEKRRCKREQQELNDTEHTVVSLGCACLESFVLPRAN